MRLKITLLLIWTTIAGSVHAQQTLPALRKAYAAAGEDTNRVNHGNDIGWELLPTDIDSALIYTEQAAALSEKLEWAKGIAFSNNQLGIIYFYNANYNHSLQCYEKSLKTWQGLSNELSMASVYGNIGNVYGETGNFSKALDNYLLALKVYEKLDKKKGMASNYGNMGAIYAQQYDFDKALNNFFKALNIYRQINEKKGIERNLMNIGTAYQGMRKNEEALKYLNQALVLAEGRNDNCAIASTLGNIGLVYEQQKKINEAQAAYERELKLAAECSDQSKLLTVLGHLGGLYIQLGKYPEAEQYLLRALEMSTKLGVVNRQKSNNQDLSQLYSLKGDYKKALDYYMQYTKAKDSLFNQEKQKEFTRTEMNYEFEKREAEVQQEQDKKDLQAAIEQKKQQYIIYGVSAGLLIMLVLAGIIFRGYRQKQKDNTIILQQKEEVETQKTIAEQQKKITEQKNKEITDSITYAKRLQNAILPSLQRVKEQLPENFIFYKPKDIVAGDFYWLEKVQFEDLKMNQFENERKKEHSHIDKFSNSQILFAVADCTGHGVPGAMVSVVCSNALNRSVNEFRLSDPGQILDKTRELVLDTFSKADEDVKDGMDISLVAISGTTIRWAGANNPLWIVRSSESGVHSSGTSQITPKDSRLPTQLSELKGHKQAIGKTENPSLFPTHELQLQKGDMLYLITDGFADQFGGPKGKKFKYLHLKELFISIHARPLTEQLQMLDTAFANWKGDLEQVDDALIVGLRL